MKILTSDEMDQVNQLPDKDGGIVLNLYYEC